MKSALFLFLLLISVTAPAQNRYPVRIDGLYGYIDSLGNVVIPPVFKEKAEFSNGFALIKTKDFLVTVINRQGKVIKVFKNWWEPLSDYYPYDFSENLLVVYDSTVDRYGFIDTSGNWKVKPIFARADNFSENRAKVGFIFTTDEKLLAAYASEGADPIKWGFIDTTGKLVIDTLYYYVSGFRNGICRADYKFIDLQGREISPDTVRDKTLQCRINSESDTFFNQKGDKYVSYYYIDFDQCLIPAQEHYDGTTGSGRYGFVNCENQWMVPPVYQDAHNFWEGLAAVSNGVFKWGYINCNGDTVIDFQYERANGFSHGLAAVKKNNRWGVIDKRNHIVIPFQFEDNSRMEYYRFEGPLILLNKGGKEVYLNRQGWIVWTEK